MLKFIFAATAAMTIGFSAHASTVYSTAVDWTNNGTVGSSHNRDDPQGALGSPDSSFLALGLTNADGSNPGFAVFDFNTLFANGTVQIWETTFGCNPKPDGSCSYAESVRVYVGTSYDFGSNDYSDVMDDFTFIGELFNADAQNGGSLLVAQTFRYVAVVDSSKANFASGPSTDGFDINAIAVNGFNEVGQIPTPTAAILMLPGLLLLRRKSQFI